MKIIRYDARGRVSYGVLAGDNSILELMGSPFEDFEVGEAVAHLSDVRLLAPVDPGKIIGVGLNYVSHIQEMGLPTPEFPMLFMKPRTAVTDPGAPIVYPHQGRQVEYEGELAPVIGRTARRVSVEDALDYVLGYTCGNDVSERLIQRAEMANGTMLVSKGFDSFCPLGPVIATGLDPTNVDLVTRLNGDVVQKTNTSDLLFSVARLVSYISEAMTLEPGDVIMTGTPSGVGPVAPGDVVEVELSRIGTLRNPVVAEG